jgi:subtilisin-like proprotein convertase family protein
MDATKLVTAALKWPTVPAQEKCTLRNFEAQNFTKEATIYFNNYFCDIRYLEQVQVQVNADFHARGALTFTLYSPGGTEAQLLQPRRNDKSKAGFRDWIFLSVATWGENPRGTWRLIVAVFDEAIAKARVFNTTLILRGFGGDFERDNYIDVY